MRDILCWFTSNDYTAYSQLLDKLNKNHVGKKSPKTKQDIPVV